MIYLIFDSVPFSRSIFYDFKFTRFSRSKSCT